MLGGGGLVEIGALGALFLVEQDLFQRPGLGDRGQGVGKGGF